MNITIWYDFRLKKFFTNNNQKLGINPPLKNFFKKYKYSNMLH